MRSQTKRKLLKCPSGIAGLDRITKGGFPKSRTSLVTGGAGSGKTTLALQFLVNGARDCNEPGIFVAFEERSTQIIENAASFGWNIPKLTAQRLFFLDARFSADTLISGTFDLQGLLAQLEEKIVRMRARRVVFDSVDILLGLLENRNQRQAELYRISEWIQRLGLTGLLTGKPAQEVLGGGVGLEMLPYIADSVIVLDHKVHDNHSRRSLRVMKYRGSSFREGECPFVIDSEGIEIVDIGDAAEIGAPAVGTRRQSTGVARLDHMLSGGYLRGSSILITGAPGTMKSTLAGAFVDACCKSGKKILHLGLDERAEETIRNLHSVGLNLQAHVDSGRLVMVSERTSLVSPELALVRLQKEIRRHRPQVVVIDPVSALIRSVNDPSSSKLAEQAIRMVKSTGATILCTSLIESGAPDHEASPVQISSIADTWIHVSYLSRAGERNRALAIVKSRGTRHSNQVREVLIDSKRGLTLSDVYTSEGEVLMGTLRWQKEESDRAMEAKTKAEIDVYEAELRLAETEIEAKVAALQRELHLKRANLARALSEVRARAVSKTRCARKISSLRGADRT